MNQYIYNKKRYVLFEKSNKMKVEDLNNWEKICKYINRDPNQLPDLYECDEIDKRHVIADFKLTICARVRNKEWVPDFSNSNQQRWYNWFIYDAVRGCFVFDVAHMIYGTTRTSTGVGVRLCFETKAKAELFARDFELLYNDLFK
jgi:hypothetical protein